MKRMMRKTILCIVALAMTCLTGAMAQSDIETKKTINSIKKSSLYIYAEATAATQQEARDIAEQMLYDEINAWAATKKKMQGGKSIVINNRKDLFTTVEMPRANMFRSFIYVKKSDVMAVDNTQVINNESAEANTPSSGTSVQTIASMDSYPQAVQRVAAVTQYDALATLIKQLKAEGEITHYARYASIEKPELYYLAIYNKEGAVVAVLTPGEDRTNVKTGQTDRLTSYEGCGAIGFRLK